MALNAEVVSSGGGGLVVMVHYPSQAPPALSRDGRYRKMDHGDPNPFALMLLKQGKEDQQGMETKGGIQMDTAFL